MMKNIVNKIKSLRVKTLRVILKSNVNKHVHQAMRYINRFRFKIEHVAFLKPIPHHDGQRKKKKWKDYNNYVYDIKKIS